VVQAVIQQETMSQRTFKIWRGNQEGGKFVEYTVETQPGMVVLDGIHRIQAEHASDLACRWNCKAGKCGSCSMEINGRPKLSCMTRLNTFAPGETITVQPLKTFPVIKDLVCDVSWNYEQNKKIAPFKPKPRDADGNHRMYRKTRTGCRSSASASSASCARMSATCCAIITSTRSLWARAS
jgi:succinate dehydrogenase / fumarate reductase iron-sulfur subunit